MKGIIGKKLGMTQVYDSTGAIQPVTVIEAGPCTVLALRTVKKDGYSAVQLGFGKRKAKNVSKAVCGHVAAAGLKDTPPAKISEFRLAADSELAIGDQLTAAIFAENEFVDISGVTKGKGFQGVVRRYGFKGGPATHGSGFHRRPGSIGMKAAPGRVLRGKHMGGRMGADTRTTQNLKVVKVRADENLLLVLGAVPGPNGGTVMVRSALKKKPAVPATTK
ncbi:MAG: 50S ribosomal protein L3 [bacterium]